MAANLFYLVTDLGPLPGGTASDAQAVNNAGQVVGHSNTEKPQHHAILWQDSGHRDLGTLSNCNYAGAGGINDKEQIVGESNLHAYLWQNGKMQDLGALSKNSRSTAMGINNRGQVVGQSCAEQGMRAFLWQRGKMSDLGTLPNGKLSFARGINDKGQVVGSSHNGEATGNYAVIHAALWDASNHVQDLGTLNGVLSYGYAINNKGQVVGESQVKIPRGETSHAFLWQNGKMLDLGTLPQHNWKSRAFAISDNEDIVGASEKPGEVHACLWREGKAIDLNDCLPANSGWTLKWANGVNEQGQIVGLGTINGQYHGFLLTPRR